MAQYLKANLVLLRDHLKIPLFTNAYALIALQVTNFFLSTLFWLAVVRHLPPGTLGIATALFSTAALVTSLANLGFGEGLAYYLPHAGQPHALINASFTLTTLTAVVLSLAFVGGINFWSPDLAFLRSLPAALLYIPCVALLQVSALLDSLLIAERISKFTLFKGVTANLLRFPFFLLFLFTRQWVYLLSAAGAAAICSVIYGYIYRVRFRPGYKFSLNLSPVVIRQMLGFSFGNYLLNLILGLPDTLLPLIILARLGAEANAYFYVSWSIGGMILIVGRSFGASLFVESSHHPSSLKTNALRSIRSSIVIILPGMLLLLVFARPILLLLGKSYSDQATLLVRLFAISAFPASIYAISIGILKAKGEVRQLLIAGAGFILFNLGLSIIFIIYWGLPGLGYAVLLARSLSMLLVLSFVLGPRESLIRWKNHSSPRES